jgi:hypothetical protein
VGDGPGLDRDVARPSSHPRPETPHHGRSAACGGWPSQRASGHYAARRSLVPRQVAVAARDAPSPGWGSSPAPAACLGRACSSRFSAAPGKRPPGSSRDPPPRLGGRQRPGALRARLDLGRPPAPHGALRSRLDLRPRGDGTRTGRPGADVRNHHANPDVNPGSSATRWFLPRPAAPWGAGGASLCERVDPRCPRGSARRYGQDDSGSELRSGPRMRWLAHGRSSRRRDDLRPRRFDEGEDPDLRRPDQLATEWTCHAGPGCRAPTKGADHSASYVGTRRVSGWRRAAPSVQRIPQVTPGIGSRSDPFRPPPAPHLRVIPFGGPFEPRHDEPTVSSRTQGARQARAVYVRILHGGMRTVRPDRHHREPAAHSVPGSRRAIARSTVPN